MSRGWIPARIVFCTRPVEGESRTTVPELDAVTQTEPAPRATNSGRRPTAIRLVTVLVAASMRTSLLPLSAVAHTAPPAAAMPTVELPTSTRAVTPGAARATSEAAASARTIYRL